MDEIELLIDLHVHNDRQGPGARLRAGIPGFLERHEHHEDAVRIVDSEEFEASLFEASAHPCPHSTK